jgi:hypothetical protein
MASTRLSQRDLADTKNARLREEMERAIASGRLVVRTMTASERDACDARWSAAQARDDRGKRRRHS